jgi:hypothetical protein
MGFFFRTCQKPGCDSLIVEETKKPLAVGAGLKIHAECSCGHQTSWQSCELLNKGRTSVIDIMISVMQLVIGLNMSQVKQFRKKTFPSSPNLYPDNGITHTS